MNRIFYKLPLTIMVTTIVLLSLVSTTRADIGPPEKTELKFGFIKLTDCAPLVIAKEKGFFDDEFLNVSLEAQSNWKVLLDRVINGELDGAHMLAGQPIGATIGIGTKAEIITAFSMDLNGNGVTVSNEIWKKMQEANPDLAGPTPKRPVSAAALKPIALAAKGAGKPLKFGMVFPVSTHNYELRYWLAAGGINPGLYINGDTTGTTQADILLSVTPPPLLHGLRRRRPESGLWHRSRHAVPRC